MSESESPRSRSKTELRRGTERIAPKPLGHVTTDEEAFLLAGDLPIVTTPDPENPRECQTL